MTMLELALIFVSQVFAAGAVYGGIRADLRSLRFRAEAAVSAAADAHHRIDQLLMQGGKRA